VPLTPSNGLRVTCSEVRLTANVRPNNCMESENMSMRRKTVVQVGICLATLIMVATGGAIAEDATTGATHEVTLTDSGLEFTPADITINIGDTVYFYWVDESMGHNVAETDSTDSNEYKQDGFRSGDVDETVHYNVTFEDAGLFFYVCEPHATLDMRGTITVIDPNAGPLDDSDPDDKQDVPGFIGTIAILSLVGAALVVRRTH